MLADRGRPGALRRRARGGSCRGRPLSRRRRPRTDRSALSPVARRCGSCWPPRRRDAPVLHCAIGSNVVGERAFRYGDPEQEFASATHRIRVDVRYPRNSCTPIETYGVIAEYDPGEGSYDVVANFQGPFSLHPVMARALKVAGNRLRLRTPRFRRQLRRQAGDLSLHCPNRGRRARRRPAGEMD